jgi:hypothetical protein
MAHQYVRQLGDDIMESIKHNIQNQITWRLSPEDASKVAKVYPPLTADDIAALPAYTVAARLYGSQGYTPTVTFSTIPDPPVTGSRNRIQARTRALYAKPVDQVRDEIAARHKAPEQKRRPKIGDLDE